MPQELQLWCYTVFPKEQFLQTNCEQHYNYVYWPAVVKITTYF